MYIKLTQEEFIEKCKTKHNNFYNYEKVIYINAKSKIIINCIKHGDFKQEASSHSRGNGCSECMKNKMSTNRRKPLIKLIEEFNIRWNFKFDYSMVEYVNNNTKIKIICPEHGIFEQPPKNHIKYDCPSCKRNSKLTIDIFINKTRNTSYLYCLPSEIRAKTIIDIKCNKHGIFKQNINNHLNMHKGCPNCKSSKGESIISEYLMNKNIKFIQQHKFIDCKNINNLRFDFYLPENNLCIEFDGLQHYIPVERFGGINYLNKIIKNDFIKNNYCLENNIKLLRIPYGDLKNIKYILDEQEIK